MTVKLTTKLVIISIFLLILIFLGLSSGLLNLNIVKSVPISEHRLVLEKIEEIGNLELVRFNFNDVIEESVVRKLFDIDNLAPDSKVLVIVNGEAAACINLKEVTENDIEITGSELKITLPPPVICYAKINHERSKIYDANFIARMFNPELIDKAYKNAESRIRNEAIKLGIIDQAKTNAKKLLGALFKSISGKNISISFKE